MIATDCPDCGEPVSTFANSCAHCGAPNAARRAGLAIAGSLAVLLLAIAIATVAVLRWERLPVEDTASTPATTEDFDTEAASTLSTLHFLVIPLRSAAGEDAAWRRRSLNDIGNAILLNSETT